MISQPRDKRGGFIVWLLINLEAIVVCKFPNVDS